MRDISVQYQTGRLTAVDCAGKTVGYVSFPQIRKGLVNIERVQIAPEYRGRGVEAVLMDALLSHLKQKGTKAALTSPMAQRYAAEHSEWKTVLPESMHMTTH